MLPAYVTTVIWSHLTRKSSAQWLVGGTIVTVKRSHLQFCYQFRRKLGCGKCSITMPAIQICSTRVIAQRRSHTCRNGFEWRLFTSSILPRMAAFCDCITAFIDCAFLHASLQFAYLYVHNSLARVVWFCHTLKWQSSTNVWTRNFMDRLVARFTLVHRRIYRAQT